MTDAYPPTPPPPKLSFPNPFADDPDADPPLGSLWTVVAWLTAAGLAFGAAILAYRRLELKRELHT